MVKPNIFLYNCNVENNQNEGWEDIYCKDDLIISNKYAFIPIFCQLPTENNSFFQPDKNLIQKNKVYCHVVS